VREALLDQFVKTERPLVGPCHGQLHSDQAITSFMISLVPA
jgi:hypothetical protein